MSVQTLQGNHHLAISYTAPWLGPIHYDVESESPISVYVFDAANLNAWKSGMPATFLGGVEGTTKFSQDVWVPSRTVWYLVLVNGLFVPTAVYFNVRS